MSSAVEIGRGQSASLPQGYIDVSLTGETGLLLRAVDGAGLDCHEPRESEHRVVVRPGAGRSRLIVEPRADRFFDRGARVGLDIKTIGDGSSAAQVLVEQLDLGGFRDFELAALSFDVVEGWTVESPHRSREVGFDFFDDAPRADTIDERELPWVGPGRYSLRAARDGDSATVSTGEPWALVVDSSASLRGLLGPQQLAYAVDHFAGILTEWSGRLPEAVGVTGLSVPRWSEEARRQPSLAGETVVEAPASWTLVCPAVEEAARRGTEVVGILVDGPPADLEELRDQLARPGSPRVVFCVLMPRSAGASADGDALLRYFRAGDQPTRIAVEAVAVAERSEGEEIDNAPGWSALARTVCEVGAR